MSRETRKSKLGTVVSNKMKDTVIVSVKWQQKHLLYRKAQRRVTKFFAHSYQSDLAIGDFVKIEECRPISRLKRWRVVDIIERRELPDVKPVELDRELLESYSSQSKKATTEVVEKATAEVAEEATAEVAEEATAEVVEEATAEVVEEAVEKKSRNKKKESTE